MNKHKLTLLVLFVINCSGGFGIPNEQVSVVAPGAGGSESTYPDTLEIYFPDNSETVIFGAEGDFSSTNFAETSIQITSIQTAPVQINYQLGHGEGVDVPSATVTPPVLINGHVTRIDTIEYGQNQSVLVTPNRMRVQNLMPELYHFSYSVREDATSGKSTFNLNAAFSDVRQMAKVDSVFLFFHANVSNDFASAVISNTHDICHLFYFDANSENLQEADGDRSSVFISRSLADIHGKYSEVLSTKAISEVVQVAFFATGITSNIVDMAQAMVGNNIYTKFFVENISLALFNRINSTNGLAVVVLRNISYSDVARIDWRLFINTIDIFPVRYTYNNMGEVDVVHEKIMRPFSFIENQNSQIIFHPTKHSFSVVFQADTSFRIANFNKRIAVTSNIDGAHRSYSVDWGAMQPLETNIERYRFTDETALGVLFSVLVRNTVNQAQQMANASNIQGATELLNRYIMEIDLVDNMTQLDLLQYREALNGALIEIQN